MQDRLKDEECYPPREHEHRHRQQAIEIPGFGERSLQPFINAGAEYGLEAGLGPFLDRKPRYAGNGQHDSEPFVGRPIDVLAREPTEEAVSSDYPKEPADSAREPQRHRQDPRPPNPRPPFSRRRDPP